MRVFLSISNLIYKQTVFYCVKIAFILSFGFIMRLFCHLIVIFLECPNDCDSKTP